MAHFSLSRVGPGSTPEQQSVLLSLLMASSDEPDEASSRWEACLKFCEKELLLVLTLVGVVLGVIVGIAANAASPARLTVTFLGFPGEILMRLLQMMVLPLIAGSMIAGVCSLQVPPFRTS